MKTSKWILKRVPVLCLLVLLGALGACNLEPQGPCYIYRATGNGRGISIEYGVRYTSGMYPQYGIHRSGYFPGSDWFQASIAEEDADASGGDQLYITATGETTITTKLSYLDNSNNETRLAENTAASRCESTYVFAGNGGGGYYPGPKVICAELHRQGLMDEAIWKVDEEFGRYLRDNEQDVLLGYQLWAKPVVKWMHKSKAFTRIVASVATPWSYEMAYRKGARNKGSFAGKILMDVGVPVCRTIGRVTIWAGNTCPRDDAEKR